MNNIRLYSFRVLCLIMIISYIFLQFIRERSFQYMYFIPYSKDLTINIVLLLIFLFAIIFYTRIICNNEIKISENFIIRIIATIKESLKAVEELLGQNIADSYDKIHNFALRFYRLLGHKEKLSLFVFYGLPYCLVSTSSFVEILTSFKLVYFYKTFILMCLPLIFTIWLYICLIN